MMPPSMFPPYLPDSSRGLAEIPGTIRYSCNFEARKKVSEIYAKCVFGLHRRDRIACAPFSKRVQKGSHKLRFFVRFRDLAPGVPKWCPRVPNGCPLGGQRPPKGSPGSAQCSQTGCQGHRNGRFWCSRVVPKFLPGTLHGPKDPPAPSKI